jgi:hypothetical protein
MMNINIKVTLITSCFSLGVFTSSIALAEPVTGKESGPERLTGSQMDIITAGTAAVATDANAAAVGDSTYAYTKTKTYAFSTPGDIVQVGLGGGLAYASGSSDADATVKTTSYGDGAIVVGKNFEVEKSSPLSSWAIGGGVIVAVNPPLGSR